MKFSLRKDLGGFAQEIPSLAVPHTLEADKPFVLLTGPNGAGKSAFMRTARATMGLFGEREGNFLTPARLGDTSDPGKLAAFSKSFFNADNQMDEQAPGVFDVGEMGWRGQPSWLFDGRSEDRLIAATQIADDVGYQAHLLMDGARKKSHGQAMHTGWGLACDWALGIVPPLSPYASPHIPKCKATLFSQVTAQGHSEERWLFLDEPELALDIEALLAGLMAIISAAEVGRLRVFCSSHSPLFAHGLVGHPKVQVLDLSPPGAVGWMERQRKALALASDIEHFTDQGNKIRQKRIRQYEDAARQAEKESDKEARKLLKKLSPARRDALVQYLVDPKLACQEVPITVSDRLRALGLLEKTDRSIDIRNRNVKITEKGRRAAKIHMEMSR